MNLTQRTEGLFLSLMELPDRIADQEEAVHAAAQARAQAQIEVDAAEAELVLNAQGSNAEQRKANVQLRKRTDLIYLDCAKRLAEADERLAEAQVEQRRLENMFKAVCYMAQLQAAALSMPGLKLPQSNGTPKETLEALGL